MKRLPVALALSVATGAASAADMAVKAPPAVAIAEYNWSGFYGGLSGEWVRSENSWRFANPGPPTLTPSTTTQDQGGIGLLGGVQEQWSHVVVGIEGSYTKVDSAYAGPASVSSLTSPCVVIVGVSCQTRLDWLATLGGKVGYAWNDWLFYGQGGWAAGHISSRFLDAAAGVLDVTDNQDYRNGWYAGIGLDYVAYKGVLADLILGLDYRHVDLGNQYQASSLDAFRAVPPNANGRYVGGTSDVVRASIILKSHGWRIFGARM